MPIQKELFGTTVAGKAVHLFTLTNENKAVAQVCDLGACLVSCKVPDRSGNLDDVILGYDTLPEYEANPPYLGVTVGRVAGRIENGKFTLNGKEYQLSLNRPPTHLHGGLDGFSKKIFDSSIEGENLKLQYVSIDGEEGYPGEVTLTATFSLRNDGGLVVDYHASSTKPTPISITNHAYFNLAGQASGPIYEHYIQIPCEKYSVLDDSLIASGELRPVAGSVYDLRQPVKMADRIGDVPGGGYDISFANDNASLNKVCARVTHPGSGRSLEVTTTQPCIHLYTSNFLDGTLKGKQGFYYQKHGGFCLESQNFPNAVNKTEFPSCILNPGETYHHTTVYKFGHEA